MENLTPMMKQYWDVKNQHQDAILFFRLGDFYEMFFDDAKEASKLLGLTLTGRSCGADEKAPMCGVPYHSAEGYIQKLVMAGKKVAICEQTEDPKEAKGIVDRSVIRIITPGTYLNEDAVSHTKNNYILCIVRVKEEEGASFQMAWADMSTGEFSGGGVAQIDFLDTFSRIQPKEVIADPSFLQFLSGKERLARQLWSLMQTQQILVTAMTQYDFSAVEAFGKKEELQSQNLSQDLMQAIDGLLGYILDTQKMAGNNMGNFHLLQGNQYVKLDYNTRRNLELSEGFQSRNKKHSLFGVLDETKTPMGARTLRKWIENPLRQLEKIQDRLDIVEEFLQDFSLREDLKVALDGVYDLERLCAKLSYETIHPKELVQMRESIKELPALLTMIRNGNSPLIQHTFGTMDSLEDIAKLLEEALLENPSLNIREGDVIRSSFSKELADLRHIEKNSAQVLKALEEKERETTGVRSLKIGYNKVFGYYIEISKANLRDLELPEGYIRKQTLSNGERYINEELKIIEEQILTARQKINELQAELYTQVKKEVYGKVSRIQQTAQRIGSLDAFLSLACVAALHDFVRPSLNENKILSIREGRHPVVEQLVENQLFVPNDTFMDPESFIVIITGPNMGGKSTYMRQTAILCLMAHMGSFVPAREANICILDAIYTRVGAADDLSQGQSTFMVEMNEVAYILEHASDNSLVLLDEVGRGTSTYDGMSIAWALLEYIGREVRCKTLFSTHYHELTSLEEELPGVRNFYVAVEEKEGSIQFLRKVLLGKTDKSYGLHVAQLAQIPPEVLELAKEKLKELENPDGGKKWGLGAQETAALYDSIQEREEEEDREAFLDFAGRRRKKTLPENQLAFFVPEEGKKEKGSGSDPAQHQELLRLLKTIDLDDTTPREAFHYLEKLKKLLISS